MLEDDKPKKAVLKMLSQRKPHHFPKRPIISYFCYVLTHLPVNVFEVAALNAE